jgi:hypothetical protein
MSRSSVLIRNSEIKKFLPIIAIIVTLQLFVIGLSITSSLEESVSREFFN